MINLIGCFLLGVFILACGLAQTGLQLIFFRTFQGIAVSMCLPTAFSILTDAFPTGRRRNIGFSCLGLGQPLGFLFGLVFGGLFKASLWVGGSATICVPESRSLCPSSIAGDCHKTLPRSRSHGPESRMRLTGLECSSRVLVWGFSHTSLRK